MPSKNAGGSRLLAALAFPIALGLPLLTGWTIFDATRSIRIAGVWATLGWLIFIVMLQLSAQLVHVQVRFVQWFFELGPGRGVLFLGLMSQVLTMLAFVVYVAWNSRKIYFVT